MIPESTPSSSEPDADALLLLSGSGLQPWIWEPLVDRLPSGTRVGIGPRPAGEDSPLEAYVEQAIDAAPDGPFAIVAHSLGAIVGLSVAAAIPDRVTGLLVVAGVVPPAGGSFLSAMPLPQRWLLDVAMRVAGTRPPDKAIRASLAAGVDPACAERIVRDFEPDSAAVFRTSLSQIDAPPRRGYVMTADDRELSPKLQDRFRRTLAPQWTTTIDSGHLPMIENPPALAAAVTEFSTGRP